MAASDAPYAERLFVPVSWWLLGALFVVSVGWAFFVATPLVAAVVAVVVTGLVVGTLLARYGSALVRVDHETLRAGRAVLPRGNVGAVVALDAVATRRLLGPDADARAFLVTRPYCRTAVRVEVLDSTDPTPYWVVSSRQPARLAAHLSCCAVQD